MTPSLAWRLWQAAAQPACKRFAQALHRPRETQTHLLHRLLRHARGSRFAETHLLHPGLGPADYARRVPVMDAAAHAEWTAPLLAGAQQVRFGPPAERLVPTSGSTGPVKLIPICAASRREYALAVNLWMADLLHTAPAIRKGRAYIATSPSLDSPLPDAALPIGYAEDEAELARLPGIWPHLQVISCWADGMCREEAERLHALFPKARLQPKGLWLTEGVVTLLWRGQHPLALLNGYYEFEDETGAPVPLEALQTGNAYRVLLSNHAGLYRYRLGDLVEVTGHLHTTPCFCWIGRADAVSDLRGEKLSEAQIERALAIARISGDARLRPDSAQTPPAYRLFTRDPHPDLAALETALCQNPHYRWARELGQLGPITRTDATGDFSLNDRPHRKRSRLTAVETLPGT